MPRDSPRTTGSVRLPKPPVRTPAAGDLTRALSQLGFYPEVRHSACGLTTGAIGINLSVQAMLTCNVTRRWHTQRIRRLLFERSAVTLTLQDVGRHTPRELESVLRLLHRASSAPCIDRQWFGLVLPGRELPLPAYLLMSRIWLGSGPRYAMLVDDPARSPSPGEGGALLSSLYQQRCRARSLSPVFATGLRSRCALLPDETGPGICTPLALVGPPNSAWLPIRFNLCRFADRFGAIREAELHAALRRALRIADAVFDHLYWPDTHQRHDARENRRIAFIPEGIGDLVLLQRADPAGLACQRALDRLLAGVHACLWDESQCLASSRGILPALAARDPLQHLTKDGMQSRWRLRWQQALARSAVRHRNLLALSPYALLPRNQAHDAGFTDLLPLLAYADTLCFAGRRSFAGWRIDEFRAFYQRAQAVMRRRNSATFVATGV